MTKLRVVILSSTVLLSVTGVFLACGGDTLEPPSNTNDGGGGGGGLDASRDQAAPDGATTDGGVDAAPDAFTQPTYVNAFGEAFCRTLARCCFGDPNLQGDAGVDGGGRYDQSSCVAFYAKDGFEESNKGASVADAGNVLVHQDIAESCIAKVAALDCNITGAALADIRSTCYGAFTGTLADGVACRGSIECGSTSFCNRALDGGAGAGIVGVCAPLRAVDAGCGDFTADDTLAEEACSYRGSGGNSRHCDSIDFNTGMDKPSANWKCLPNVANGQNCYFTNWCSTGVCDGNTNTCTSPDTYFTHFACVPFVTP